ncbi:MAG: class I SAM-dependent methyltransferase [Alphaproteobacteria bacterium]|nr:class I SAM-dependent methyltransferase [Alphaproteobacteria bacterium]
MRINRRRSVSYPFYMHYIYGSPYNSKAKCRSYDNNFSANLRTFGCYSHLVGLLNDELKSGQSVCQFGITFGSQIDETALTIGRSGIYNIIDINSAEIKRLTAKHGKLYPQISFIRDNVAEITPRATYDVVISFMLLSMTPDSLKPQIINNALKSLRVGGKAVFIDYHRPVWWHPLGKLLRTYYRLRYPFVDTLFSRSLSSFVSPELRSSFIWRRTLCFGGLFQKTIATRREILTR